MSAESSDARLQHARGYRLAGRVSALWRYPVKSTCGEALATARVTARGLQGDRAFALVDAATRRVASAKHPRKWGRLLEMHSSFLAPSGPGQASRVTMQLPDGTAIHSDDPRCHERLGQVFGWPVELVGIAPAHPTIERYWPDVPGLSPAMNNVAPGSVTEDEIGDAAPATFFDFAPIHLITTATMKALGHLHPRGDTFVREVLRFRPNIVIETPADAQPFVEDTWVGHTLALGDEVAVAVAFPTPRCVVPSLAAHGLAADLDVLRTVARHHRVEIPGLGGFACAGVYGQIVREGTVRLDDAARIAEQDEHASAG